jgi:hypothetical protein
LEAEIKKNLAGLGYEFWIGGKCFRKLYWF